MSTVLWILVAVAAALALYAAGAIGWALGRRASQDGGAGSAMPVLAEVPARTGAAVLVALDNLSELLDRRDVLVINTVTTGMDPRAEVVDVAVCSRGRAAAPGVLRRPGRGPPTLRCRVAAFPDYRLGGSRSLPARRSSTTSIGQPT